MTLRRAAVLALALLATNASLPGLRPTPFAQAYRADHSPSPLQTLDIAFINPTTGWLLAARWGRVRGAYGSLFVGRTGDGGRTWRMVGTIHGGLVRQDGNWNDTVTAIRFADSHDGWAYGTRLYSTHDGGRDWQRLPIGGGRTSVSVAGRSAWRVDTRCFGATCRAILFTSTAGTDRWQRLAWQPPRSWTTTASLIRADPRHAWLLSGELSVPPNHLTQRLLATDDAGKTWHSLPLPCATQGPVGDFLAAFDRRHVWAFCASVPGAGQQLKTVDRSDDGGRHWHLVAGSGRDGLKNISSSGYLRNAALTSPSTAWLALGRGTLLHTADVGRTWREAIPYARANPLDGGVGPVVFVDPRHGWLLSLPHLLFHTVDGGRHWREIRLP